MHSYSMPVSLCLTSDIGNTEVMNSRMCKQKVNLQWIIPYSGFILWAKILTNFAFLLLFVKMTFRKIDPESVLNFLVKT